ncbi:hypothetical protein Asi02nite_13670 [Asanoa siamensis]|uniref:Uncharacterized protein n=1 Tax=Asanoa siamensis TaxID=926357 RepID=A0ABQ4CKP5_9ACTN|nr:hypothetical protein Asi02nite_13670 [Asanoa siamensis]
MAVGGDALADDRPDHRVQTGTVPAAGKHADSHDLLILLIAILAPKGIYGQKAPGSVIGVVAGPGRAANCAL